jgi:hypothetical protein
MSGGPHLRGVSTRRAVLGAVGVGLSGCLGRGRSAAATATENRNADDSTGTETGDGTAGCELERAVELVSASRYEDGGTVGVRGVVRNRGPTTLDALTVRVRFLDESGTVVGEGMDLVEYLPTGVGYAFDATFVASGDATGEDVAAHDVGYEWRASHGLPDSSTPGNDLVAVVDHELKTVTEFGSEKLVVDGTAKNVSDGDLSYATVVGRFFDGDDVIVAQNSDIVESLGAGETWSFRVSYLSLAEVSQDAVERYEVWGRGSS